MNRRLGAAALSAAAVLLCSCSQAQAAPHQTFKTVNTSGITAYKTPTDENGNYITGEPTETDSFETTSISSAEDPAPTEPVTTESSLDEMATQGATAPAENSSPQFAQTEDTAEQTARTDMTTTVPADSSEYSVIGDNGILVTKRADGHYWGLMPCWGTYGLCESWAESANSFAAALPDVKTYQMTIPTSSEFYVPAEYSSGFTGSQLAKIEHIAQNLKNIKNIDAYSALNEHKDEKIFSRTDHHWFPLGAYYAAQVFAEDAGVDFADISEYKKVTMGGYVGSMYSYSNDVHLKNDPEDFDLYLSPNRSEITTNYYGKSFENGYESDLFTSPDGGAYYCSFIGSDDRIAEITTDCKNGRTLVIFKESYGNALVPFLTSSFERIYVCDIRYFNLNAVDFCKEVGATDLLFAVCTYTPAGSNGNYLGIIINQ